MAGVKNLGCRFSLYPMTDDFVSIILGALDKTDTSRIYSFTDAVSTVYQGDCASVIDAVRALFTNAYTDGVHMAIEGSFSNSEAVTNRPEDSGLCPNAAALDIHFPLKCKLTLFANENGMKIFDGLMRRAAREGLSPENISYGTRLDGDVQAVFALVERLCGELGKAGGIFTLSFTMSANSPTREN